MIEDEEFEEVFTCMDCGDVVDEGYNRCDSCTDDIKRDALQDLLDEGCTVIAFEALGKITEVKEPDIDMLLNGSYMLIKCNTANSNEHMFIVPTLVDWAEGAEGDKIVEYCTDHNILHYQTLKAKTLSDYLEDLL